ncbi:hypothetical protein VE01_07331 [Pseudogymnoascus verrucosus]|uniref:Pirin n=1 Tax=Pseudogymnoascus verrucosus TaxID=342668 RepID=A0A1B8GGV4_9PEZI|nr:uncharacterized protein VE01_07331 [Pseudogymnoascus verrucosus]OBT95068.1 hypothetical protein VE01_07331 [Pseudogymnoascus verrucosus]
MKLFLFIFTTAIAIISIAFSDTILARIGPLTDLLHRNHNNQTTVTTSSSNSQTTGSTSFEGLPVIPPTEIYGEPKAEAMSVPRAIRKAFLAIQQSEGVGAKVRRSIGTPQLRNFSPFLMLDHFTSSPGSGFPDHPHRGQETITYLLSGAVDHEDFAGNKGTIEAGDLQFMTAGRGIMHAEMPRELSDGSPVVGMQLWVDLPEKLKMCEPRYRDLRASEIPQVKTDDGKVNIKVISGQSHGVDSVKELAYTPVWIFDIEVQPGGKITQPIPAGWNAFAYTLAGTTSFGSGEEKTEVGQFHNVVFEQAGDTVTAAVAADATEPGHFYLVAGLPLDQKVVQYGPFVLNSQEQVYNALRDYQNHQNGFERAKGWQSEIGKRMMQ